jgi:5-methylcytosine-specific restriction protein A
MSEQDMQAIHNAVMDGDVSPNTARRIIASGNAEAVEVIRQCLQWRAAKHAL